MHLIQAMDQLSTSEQNTNKILSRLRTQYTKNEQRTKLKKDESKNETNYAERMNETILCILFSFSQVVQCVSLSHTCIQSYAHSLTH